MEPDRRDVVDDTGTRDFWIGVGGMSLMVAIAIILAIVS